MKKLTVYECECGSQSLYEGRACWNLSYRAHPPGADRRYTKSVTYLHPSFLSSDVLVEEAARALAAAHYEHHTRPPVVERRFATASPPEPDFNHLARASLVALQRKLGEAE